MIDDSRTQTLNDAPTAEQGRYVLYWMQQSQRAEYNHALEYAVREANALGLPVLVGFGLTDGYPDANARHYAFMLQGLREVAETLRKRGIGFVMRRGEPPRCALDLGKEAALIVADRGYLRHQKRWRETLAGDADCRVIQVESDVVVPVEEASDKREYAARTLRPKINKLRERYMSRLGASKLKHSAAKLDVEGELDPGDPDKALSALDVDRSVTPVERFRGGTSEAKRRLTGFLRGALVGYADDRGEPAERACSELSPYLHFGQISPLQIALRVERSSTNETDRRAYLEELIVRRELAINFVEFTSDYDQYKTLPDWARKTLAEHRDDRRERVYTREELENAATDDRYWNAAMREMLATGYMHNHMRMYWAKRILAWTNTPEYGYRTTLYLNNKYFLDGRDCNSYANVAWCYGLHDRPWQEREVFGKVRTMTASGLERKFDMDAYVRQVERMAEREGADGKA